MLTARAGRARPRPRPDPWPCRPPARRAATGPTASPIDSVFRRWLMRTRLFTEVRLLPPAASRHLGGANSPGRRARPPARAGGAQGWGRGEDLMRLLRLRRRMSGADATAAATAAAATATATAPTPAPPSEPTPAAAHLDDVRSCIEAARVRVDAARPGVAAPAGARLLEGTFHSPLDGVLPGLLPTEARTARFQMLLPTAAPRGVCLILAGTGDHYFHRRRVLLAEPLLRRTGIGSVILENPYYGVRRPSGQRRSSLRYVSDLFAMGAALSLEAVVLFRWCAAQGFGPLGISGTSMGGHMAAVAGCAWPQPVAIVPCLTAASASHVFTNGVMSTAVAWSRLTADRQTAESVVAALGDLRPPVLSEAAQRALQQRAAANLPPDACPRTVQLLRQLLDEASYIGNFRRPVAPHAAVCVIAQRDAYVPLESADLLARLWGARKRYVPGGHVASSLLRQHVFCDAIADAFHSLDAATEHGGGGGGGGGAADGDGDGRTGGRRDFAAG